MLVDAVKFAANPSTRSAVKYGLKYAGKYLKSSSKRHNKSNDKNVGVKEVEGHVGGTITRSSYTVAKRKSHSATLLTSCDSSTYMSFDFFHSYIFIVGLVVTFRG